MSPSSFRSPRDFSGMELIAGPGFGIRNKQQQQQQHAGASSPGLKVSKDSHRIRKPPLPLPQVQYRPPVIIHTYSPKVLHTEPDDFMSLVQKLTGSNDTRLRLKKMKPSKPKAEPKAKVEPPIQHAAIQRQDSGSSSTCGSEPSSSSEENNSATFLAKEMVTTVKQSNSPRSPFDSDFEFDNNDCNSLSGMLAQFDDNGPLPIVKAEPQFSFDKNMNSSSSSSSFPFHFTDSFMQHPPKQQQLARPQIMHNSTMSSFNNIDNVHNAPPGSSYGLSPHLLVGLPDLSPGIWQSGNNYLDCLSSGGGGGGPTSGQAPFINQSPYLRQCQFSGAYSDSFP